MPWESKNNPFSKTFWKMVADEDWGEDFKRGGVELVKMGTMDFGHWKHEFNGDLDAAYADLDNYSAKEFAFDLGILALSFVGGAAIAKGATMAAKTTAGQALSRALAKGASKAGQTIAQANKAFLASANRAKTMLKLFSTKKLVGEEAHAYTRVAIDAFDTMATEGSIMLEGEKIALDNEMKFYMENTLGSYRAGLEQSEEKALDLAGASLGRMQTTLEEKIAAEEALIATEEAATKAEAEAIREGYKIPTIEDFKMASRDAQHPYGRNPTAEEFEAWKTAEIEIRKLDAAIKGEFVGLDAEVKTAADKTFDLLGKTELSLTEDELLTAQFDVLVDEYAAGNNVFDDIIKKLGERQALRNEQIASRETAFNTQWETQTARQEYLNMLDEAYGSNVVAREAHKDAMKKLMRDLIVLGVPSLAVGRVLFGYKPQILKKAEKSENVDTTPDKTDWHKAIENAILKGLLPGTIEDYTTAIEKSKEAGPAKRTDEIVLTEIAKVLGKGAGATSAASQTGVMVPGSVESSMVGGGLSILEQLGVPAADLLNALWSYKSTISSGAEAAEMVAQTASEAEMLSVLLGLGVGGASALAAGGASAAIVNAAYNEIQTPIAQDKVQTLVDQAVVDAARNHKASTAITIPTQDEDITALSRNMIMELAQYATDVYLPTQGYSVIAEFTDEGGDFYARLYDAGDHDVLSFRGSKTSADWVSNFDARKTPLSSVFPNEGFDSRGVDLQVHNGIATGLKTQFTQIRDFIIQRNQHFRITGHSRGGALGTLFAYVYAITSPDNIQPFETITFGSPRVFASGSSQQYGSVVSNAFRVYNDQDKVPMLPPQSMGFEHVGVGIELFANKFMIYVDEKGDFRFARENYAMVDHSPYNGTNIAYQQTAILLNKSQETFEYVKQTVIDELPQGARELRNAIEKAQRPSNNIFMRTVNNVMQLDPDRPISIYMLGLSDGQYMHSMNVYLTRIQKMPPFLYGIPFTPEEEDDEVDTDDDAFDDNHDAISAPVHIPDFTINTPGTQCVCKPKTIIRNGRRLKSAEAECECPTTGKSENMILPESGSPKSVINKQVQILGYVLYPEYQAPEYLNHYVAFV